MLAPQPAMCQTYSYKDREITSRGTNVTARHRSVEECKTEETEIKTKDNNRQNNRVNKETK